MSTAALVTGGSRGIGRSIALPPVRSAMGGGVMGTSSSRACAFLRSPEAAHTPGQVLVVDGGPSVAPPFPVGTGTSRSKEDL